MNKLRLVVLVENRVRDAGLLGEHGWAVWIETPDRRLLFDAGQSRLIEANARVFGVDLSRVDAVALSHGHYDHAGGLAGILEQADDADIYLHPEALRRRYSCHPGKPARQIGVPALTAAKLRNRRNTRWMDAPQEVARGVWLTGPIERIYDFEDVGGPFYLDERTRMPDDLIDDQALFIETPRGIVVVLGCAHAGVINTLEYIRRLTDRNISAVMGGMHLEHACPERLHKTLAFLQRFDLDFIGPAHCTGESAEAMLKDAFGNKCQTISTGTIVTEDLFD